MGGGGIGAGMGGGIGAGWWGGKVSGGRCQQRNCSGIKRGGICFVSF